MITTDLRTLLPIYEIRVSTIQELRVIPRTKLSLEGIVGRLTTFELSNFDNYRPENIESTFKALLLLDTEEVKPKKKKRKVKYASSDNNIDEEDVE